MSALSQLAGFISELEFDSLPPDTLNHLKMHILDSIGAALIGIHSREGEAVASLIHEIIPANGARKSHPDKSTLLPSVISSCSAARCTECDDIHLESCTTPGSIIVPTAISLANAGYISAPREFIATVLVGYEVLIRFGLAINGPAVLQKGIWPTYFAAPVGSAAVTARALKLNPAQTSNALSTAFAFSSGTVIHPHGELTSRWLTIGLAAQNGVIAAFSAQKGFQGSEALAAATSGQFHGLPFDACKLTDKLGKRLMIDETGMKPYPVARQGLSAVEAFREIINRNLINVPSIEHIKVMVPDSVIGVINRPTLTGNRLDAISSLQYQIALSAINTEVLLDLKREQVLQDESITTLMQKVRIISDAELNTYYPVTWPARVEITARGQVYTGEMLYPPGDHRNWLSWEELINKFKRASRRILPGLAAEGIINSIQKLDAINDLLCLRELTSRH